MTTLSLNSWHIGVAAEACAAALFARCGFDVSVQYGANQPGYDLIVARGDKMLKVSVKGSKDWGWGLTQSYLKEANYHRAIDSWLERHTLRLVLCFVQFADVPIDQMPRTYLATPKEVADRLKATAKGRGDTILYEKHAWGTKAFGAGSVEQIPDSWKFSTARVEHLLNEA